MLSSKIMCYQLHATKKESSNAPLASNIPAKGVLLLQGVVRPSEGYKTYS